MDTRLSKWKASSLSLARHALVSSVVATLPYYAMQTTSLPSVTCLEIDKSCRHFLWGSTGNQREIHLVSWDRVCRRKCEGGLGLRHAASQNAAFMMKLGWGVIRKRDALWVQFMRDKYKCGDNVIPKVIKRRNSSQAWKGIYSNRDKVCQGINYRLDNGRSALFWKDIWIPHMEPLVNPASSPVTDDMLRWKVADVLLNEGNWECDKFVQLLPRDISEVINRISIDLHREDVDTPIWRWSSDGQFSVKSAYRSLQHAVRGEYRLSWRNLWKLNVPHRCRSFLWLCASDKILTNISKQRKGMHVTGRCDLCGLHPETALHALRDCEQAQHVWSTIVPPKWRHRFFQSSETGFAGILQSLAWLMIMNGSSGFRSFVWWFTIL